MTVQTHQENSIYVRREIGRANFVYLYAITPLCMVMGNSNSVEERVVQHVLYRVPKKNHDANIDEEVWIESIYYRDRQHMEEVIAKMANDERCEQSYKQSLELLPSGVKFITGGFDRLIV
jgi:uncharacterized protein YbaA (DUF1428 family)